MKTNKRSRFNKYWNLF